MIAAVDKIIAQARFLTQKLRREPSDEEVAAELGLPAETVHAVHRIARGPLDLDDDAATLPEALLRGELAIVSPLDVGRWFASKHPEPKSVVVVAGPLEGYAGDVVDDDGDTVRVALLLLGRPEIVEFSVEDLAPEAGTAVGVRRWARQSFERSIAAKLVMFWEEASQLEPAERYRAAAHLRRELEDRAAPEIDAFAAELSDAMTARPDEAVESAFVDPRGGEHGPLAWGRGSCYVHFVTGRCNATCWWAPSMAA